MEAKFATLCKPPGATTKSLPPATPSYKENMTVIREGIYHAVILHHAAILRVLVTLPCRLYQLPPMLLATCSSQDLVRLLVAPMPREQRRTQLP